LFADDNNVFLCHESLDVLIETVNNELKLIAPRLICHYLSASFVNCLSVLSDLFCLSHTLMTLMINSSCTECVELKLIN